jgi:hypothetical protein
LRVWFRRFREWKQASLLRRTVVTVAAFVLIACASIATMSYAAVAATQAIFKSPGSSSGAAANPSSAPSDADSAGPGLRLPTKTASTPQKGAVRSKGRPDALQQGGDED